MIVLNFSHLPPSTNNLFINTRKGRVRSSKYDAWATEAGWELLSQRPPKVIGEVVLKFEFQEPKQRSDVSNRIKATEDLLVAHGVIEGDDNRFVRKIEAEWTSTVVGMRVTITSGKAKA